MPAPLGSPVFQWFTPAGDPAAGYKVYTYEAGSSTPKPVYGTASNAALASSPLSNPVILDANGQAQIWLVDSPPLYKVVIKTSADVVVSTIDNLDGSGGAGLTGGGSVSQWQLLGYTPTFLSATSFSVPIDATGLLSPGTRTQTANTAGSVYSQVASATFAAGVTTVTVVNSSGVLDSGLSSVAYGLVSATNSSLPVKTDLAMSGSATTLVSGSYVQLTKAASANDLLSEVTSNVFVPRVTGSYQIASVVSVTSAGATTGISGQTQTAAIFRNSSLYQAGSSISWPFADSQARSSSIVSLNVVSLTAGDNVDLRVQGTFTGTAPTAAYTYMLIRRIA